MADERNCRKVNQEPMTSPMAQQQAARRRVGWRAAPYIFGNYSLSSLVACKSFSPACGACDFFSSTGVILNMMPYLMTRLHLETATAATTVNNFMGILAYTPLLGAFLADAYVGRYRTILVSAFVLSGGLIWLLITSVLSFGRPPYCSKSSCLGILYSAFIIISLGVGGIRPNATSFGADQFDQKDPTQKKQLLSFFNWYYLSVVSAVTLSTTFLVYICTSFGWTWGFGIAAAAIAISAAIFWAGVPLYRQFQPQGSPFTRLAQVAVAAVRRRHLPLPEHPSLLYQDEETPQDGIELCHTMQFRFLDKAATCTDDDLHNKPSKWYLCSVSQIEELKSLIRMVPVWVTGIPVFIAWSQQGTLWIAAGMNMNLHLGHFKIPVPSLPIFALFTMLIFLPVYDRLVLPLARKLTGQSRGLSLLQRIGVGVVLTASAMVIAGLVEVKRRKASGEHRISVLWLVPQFSVLGLAEAFVLVGYLEFFYDQSPPSLRSMAAAVVWAIIGTGSYLSSLIIAVVQKITHGAWVADDPDKGHLEYFYYLLAVIVAIDFLLHLLIAWRYQYTMPSYGNRDDNAIPVL